jgi:hypothetical protein
MKAQEVPELGLPSRAQPPLNKCLMHIYGVPNYGHYKISLTRRFFTYIIKRTTLSTKTALSGEVTLLRVDIVSKYWDLNKHYSSGIVSKTVKMPGIKFEIYFETEVYTVQFPCPNR